MAALLEVENLRKQFNLHILNEKVIVALDKIGFALDKGEAIGLTGKSGSGKSTLMKCVYRTYLATSGHIWYTSPAYGRVDLARVSEHLILKLRREEITYCSQFLSVIPRIPALEVVAAALVRRNDETPEDALTIARDHLARLNLPEELWDAYPSTFSGGEQQRINIARAIISRPRFLLVDEPTASLDPKTKDAVIDMVLELKNQGTSVLCITHDQYTLERMSDRIFRLDTGDFVSTAQEALPGLGAAS